jgi:hypothetical protein
MRFLARLDEVLQRHPVLTLVLPYPLFLLAGLALVRDGTSTWDTVPHLQHGQWLIGRWHGEDLPLPYERMRWLGPLWEYVLSAFGAALSFLQDPLAVRHAVTFSLLPLTLLGMYLLLRRAGETAGTALLAVTLVAGNVRFLGHAVLNVSDFPFACGYLLVTLAMWVVLHERAGTPEALLRRPGTLALLTVLSVVPYLLRVPVFTHWLALVGISLWAAAETAKKPGAARRWIIAGLPVVLGPLLVFAVSPGLWEAGPWGLVSTVSLFSRFPWEGEGTVRLFGVLHDVSRLPWWYGPAWIAVSWVPIGLVVLAVGGTLALPTVAREAWHRRPWPLQPVFGSHTVWVAVFAALPWVAVLALRPTLYDEDRHLLFAMPLLGVCAAFGLRSLPERSKGALAVLVLGSSLWSVIAWGRYSYVYKDSLLPRSANEDFTGDYWGVSMGPLTQAVHDLVPAGSYVLVMGRGDAFTGELERRGRSLLLEGSAARQYDVRQKARRRGQFFVAAINRDGSCRPLLDDLATHRSHEIWRAPMPRGGLAALLVYYARPCGDCPKRLHSN